MITHPAFTTEPWRCREWTLDLSVLAQSESIFTLANGHLGLRGNLDEGEPAGVPGTYLNSVYDLRPLAYGESAYGDPESSQTIINVTNGKLIRLLVDDEPFDVRYGTLDAHERIFDVRAGTLERHVTWTSPTGRQIQLRSVRLVSFTHRAVAAISYEVEAVDRAVRLVVQSELLANEPRTAQGSVNDPRQGAGLEAPLRAEAHWSRDLAAGLVHRTRSSGLRVAAAMDHLVDGPAGTASDCESADDVARATMTTRLEPGQRLRIVKFLAYGWSSERSPQALSDQVIAALRAARLTGWERLQAEQRAFLEVFWDRADVELDGDVEVQQAVRFGMFHVVQAGVRGEDRAIPAKGLTGPGYDGHAFWDTEIFVLPLSTYTFPAATASALRWRQRTLPLARARARALGRDGAAFPWRTIAGQESSAYWPASTAAFHVNADIADAVVRYIGATDDREFERTTALELLVETARLWRSLGHYERGGGFRIDGVTGPDEYSAVQDNNIYTNLMAQQNLRAAADVAERFPEAATALGVAETDVAQWRRAAASMVLPYDAELGVHAQSENFTSHEVWDFASTPPENYPLFLHYPYVELYRKQVVKQPDLVLAMFLRGDAFSDEQKARNFAYYEQLTVRDSSLAAGTLAVIAAEVGHTDLAYDYLREAALMDLEDREHNTSDGVHMASLAGAWTGLVAGFGGMRAYGGALSFAPKLATGMNQLRFRMLFRGRRLRVTVTHDAARYELLDGLPLEISHYGQPVKMAVGAEVDRPIPVREQPPRPVQPVGREPPRRLVVPD
ncbi:MAG TPA: glycosyl hydrolase family 65 protein [Chloroflexota bacterium]